MMFALAACSREPAVISPPKDAAAVVEPFLKALSKGDKAGAGKYVSTAAADELETQFAADARKLAASAKLTPRFVTNPLEPGFAGSSEGDEVTLVYAARKNDKWTSATVRVYRYRDEAYKVEYWRVSNAEPTLPLPSGMTPEVAKMQHTMMYVMFGGIGLLGLLGLGVLLWLVKRKPHLVVNEVPTETRQAASTFRDE
jgi:hypothetical protein